MTARPFDIVVFGASGFTGVRVLEYLVVAQHTGRCADLKVAAAARSEAKVRGLLEPRLCAQGIQAAVAAAVPFVQADVSDEASIRAMCAQARVVIGCVGPFRLYGEVVVRACVESATDYVDITGEPFFIDSMHAKYHTAAKAKDVLIVPACGFDSVPADLGVVFATRQFSPPEVAATVESFFTLIPGPHGVGGNIGTYETFLESVKGTPELDALRKMTPRPRVTTVGRPLKRKARPYFEPRIGRWAMLFFGSDAMVVRNSQSHLVELAEKAGEQPVQYSAYVNIGSFWTMLTVVVVLAATVLLARVPGMKGVMTRYPELFTFGIFRTTGPTEEQIASTSFTMQFYAKGYKTAPSSPAQKPDIEVVTRVAGPELGYVTTVICVCEAAFTILDEKRKLLMRGVLTPAAALRTSTYIDRLNRGGVTFALVSKQSLA